ELTWYDNGVVAVNKLFGNYDYGNGCLLEYKPSQIALEAQSRVDMETQSCAWNAVPSASPALSLVASHARQVELRWNKVSDAEFYRIYRDEVVIANSAAIKTLTFTDTDLTPDHAYRYQVEACNSHGCAAQKSAELLVTTAAEVALVPSSPAAPVLVGAGTRFNLVNWQPVDGATFYQIWRDGQLLADQQTELSYTDGTGLQAGTEYRYTIKACNAQGCSEHSAEARIVNAARDALAVNVQHKDPTTAPVIVNVVTQHGTASNVVNSGNRSYVDSGLYENAGSIYTGGRYRAPIKGQPVNGQLCTSDTPSNRTTGGKNVQIEVDCYTAARLISPLPENTFTLLLADNFEYYLPKPAIQRSQDGAEIISNAILYHSSNESVIRVDEQGRVMLHGAGEAVITVTLDPQYYDLAEPLEYKVTVAAPAQSRVLQRVEIGQASLLSPGATHQILAPKGKTLVRAYVYADDAAHTTMPEVKLHLTANGQTLSKDMVCPAQAKVGSFATPSYDITETCYSIIDTDEAQNFIVNGMRLEVATSDNQRLVSHPKVNKNATINVRLIPGQDTNGVSRPVDVESFKNTLLQTYPVATANVSVREPYALSTDPGAALGQVEAVRRLETDGKTYFYGLVPKGCAGVTGNAYVNGSSAVGVDSRCGTYRDSTFAHELGHNLSLSHAPGCGVTSSDPFWASNAWPGVSRAALSPAPMFEKAENIVIAPTDSRVRRDSDLMNYCFGYRFTEYNYQRIANYMNSKSWFGEQVQRKQAPQASEPMLLIAGEIVGAKVVLQPVTTSNNPMSAGYDYVGDSEYTIAVNSSDGVVIYPLPLMPIDHADRKVFFMEVPASAKLNALKIFAGDAELPIEIDGLAEQKAQASRLKHSGPTITYQAGQLVWDNSTYPWLTVVHTKADGSRHTLALQQTGGEFKLETKGLTAGSLHVSLSDGLNSVTYTEVLGK
ncbi:MAG: chitinase N-terminal domain-containing protein, partial [Aeromonas sp.]